MVRFVRLQTAAGRRCVGYVVDGDALDVRLGAGCHLVLQALQAHGIGR